MKHDSKTLVNTCLTMHRFALRRSVLYLVLSVCLSLCFSLSLPLSLSLSLSLCSWQTRALVYLVPPDAVTTLKQKYHQGWSREKCHSAPTSRKRRAYVRTREAAITEQLKKSAGLTVRVYLTNLINVTCEQRLVNGPERSFMSPLRRLCARVSFCRAARIHRGNKP